MTAPGRVVARLLVAAATIGGGCAEPEPTPRRVQFVQILADVPEGLQDHEGWVPVRFGVPFREGALPADAKVELLQTLDGKEERVPVQTAITARYAPPPDGAPSSVEWLLVDGLLRLERGSVGLVRLAYGDRGVQIGTEEPFSWEDGYAARLTGGRPPTGPLDRAALGEFILTVRDEQGESVEYVATNDAPVVESKGAVRSVIKLAGSYRSRTGRSIGEFTTRYVVGSGLPYVRVVHTLVWGRDGEGPDQREVPDEEGFDYAVAPERLAFVLPSLGSVGCTPLQVGVADAAPIALDGCSPSTVVQLDESTVRIEANGAQEQTARLSGWLARPAAAEHSALFVGLRWAAEQFPSGFGVDPVHGPRVNLLDANGLTWWQLSSNADTDEGSPVAVQSELRPARESAVGVAKTYELLIWPDAEALAGMGKAMLEGGVVAYPDPEFVAASGAPFPMGAKRVVDATTNRTEAALADMFTFATRVSNPGPTSENGRTRLGAFHFGDVFKDWNANEAEHNYAFPRKYWMNTGSGFTAVPWLLFLRSGERRYRELGDANARHVADVDTMHVTRAVDGLWKYRGGQTLYANTHGAFPLLHRPADLWGKTAELDGLVLAYVVSGDERLRDVLQERADLVVSHWRDSESALREQIGEVNAPDAAIFPFAFERGRAPLRDGPQPIIRTMADLASLAPVFGDEQPELYEAGEAALVAVLALQQPDGWFPPSRSTSLDHGLAAAARAFPRHRERALSALAAWAEYRGDPAKPGPTGKVVEPYSAAGSMALYDATRDERILRRAQSHVYAQALSVIAPPAASDSGVAWTGMGPFGEHMQGALVRDWLLVLAHSKGSPLEGAVPPFPYVRRIVSDDQTWDDTFDLTRVYVAKGAGEDLVMPLDFSLFDSPGVLRRPVTIHSYPPDGGEPSRADYCITWRGAQFAEAHLGWTQPPGADACSIGSAPGESVVHVLPEAWRGLSGSFRFDIVQSRFSGAVGDPDGGLSALGVHASAYRVRTAPGSALSFGSPTGGHVELALPPTEPRSARTIAVRLRAASDDPMVALDTGSMRIETAAGAVRATFGVEGDANDDALTVEAQAPAALSSAAAVIADVRVDEQLQRIAGRLCVRASELDATEVCHEASRSVPVPRLGSLDSLTIGADSQGRVGFRGTVDDLRILPRLLTSSERNNYGSGALLSLDVRDLSDGLAFTFDDTLAEVSGADVRVLRGVPGVDFEFEATPSPTRVGYAAPVVFYDQSQDQRPYDPPHAPCPADQLYPSNDWCSLRTPTQLVVGSMYAVPLEGTAQSLKVFGARFSQVGFLDPRGRPFGAGRIDSDDPELFKGMVAVSDSSLAYGIWYASDSVATPAYHAGFRPVLSYDAASFFDPFSCEGRRRVASFGTTGSFEVDVRTDGGSYSLAFKTRHAHRSSETTVASIRGEVVIRMSHGVAHALFASGDALRVPYPSDQWTELALQVEPRGSHRTAKLLVDGVVVDQRQVGRSDFAAGTLVIGRDDSSTSSFDGWVDDVAFAQTLASAAPTWSGCRDVARPGEILESFESCPALTGDAVIVDRAAPHAVSCP